MSHSSAPMEPTWTTSGAVHSVERGCEARHGIRRVVGRPAARSMMSRGLRSAGAVMTLVVVGGCGTGGAATPAPPGSHGGAAGISVRYESVTEGGEAGGVPLILQVLARGDQFRMSVSDATTPDEVYQTVVWDGGAMLLLEGEDTSRQENPPPGERPSSFVIRKGDDTFERLCPGAERRGSESVAGRTGTTYSCPAHGTGDLATVSSTITLDDATGLLLSRVSATGHMVATEVETDVEVEEGAFSTEVPPGMHGNDAESRLPLTSVDRIPLAGGGELDLADIRHGPSLVVIGELPGVTAMLTRVLPRTGQGTAPRVYVLLNPIAYDEPDDPDDPDQSLATDEGTTKLIDQVSARVGDVPVPVGIDIKGGAAGEDLRSFEELMAGTTVLAAIDEAGALAWRLTDAELADNRDELDSWIASNS